MGINRIIVAWALVVACLWGTVARADSVVVEAISLWTAEGAMLKTDPGTSVFAGSLKGPYLVDTGQGPILAGTLACVGRLSADIETGEQRGEAQCQLTASDGAIGYARFSCEGVRLVGCIGPFEFTGGEGRLEGLSGGGEIVFRRSGGTLSDGGDGTVRETAFGVASWKDLTVTMPDRR